MSYEQKREELLTLQKELQDRLAAIEKDLHNERSRDSGEYAQEQENDDVLRGLILDAQLELRQLSAALLKIDAGTYGTCSECGEKIDPKRLELIPEATHCIDCAQTSEH